MNSKHTPGPEVHSVKDLMEKDFPPTMEEEYRRAYRDGWIAAVEAFYELMARDGLSRKEAHFVAYEHWEDMLSDWEDKAKDKPNSTEEPPLIPAENRVKSRLKKVMGKPIKHSAKNIQTARDWIRRYTRDHGWSKHWSGFTPSYLCAEMGIGLQEAGAILSNLEEEGFIYDNKHGNRFTLPSGRTYATRYYMTTKAESKSDGRR